MTVDADTQAAIDEFTGGEKLEAPSWAVDSPETADAALEKIARAERRLAAELKVRDAAISRADAWYAKRTERAQKWVDLLTGQLEKWFFKLYTAKHKSQSLPAGSVGFRKRKPLIEVVDDDAAWAWAKAYAPEVIATRSSIAMDELNRRFARTGELPDGGKLVNRPPKFFVKTNGGENDDGDENGDEDASDG